MTTLNEAFGSSATAGREVLPSVDVFGVAWPLYKLHAVLAAALATVVILAAGGTGTVAVWVSAVVAIVVWWGERAALGARWDDGGRDHARS